MRASRAAALVFLGAFVVLCNSSASAWAQAPEPTTTHAVSAGKPALNGTDADSLLRIAVPKTLKNRRESMAYTYEINYRNRNFSERGKLLIDYSAKYDVIFVGGLPYRRLVEEDRKPLSTEEAAEEIRRYEKTFEERSRMSIDQKRDYLKRPWNVDFPLPQLASLFTNHVVGEEMVDGRAAIVIESKPRTDAHPADEEERRAMHKAVKLWIDREDLVVSRIEATLVADDAAMKKGTRARIEFMRKNGVYLPAESDVQFETVNGQGIIRGETLEQNADFHRFHVDVRLLTAPAAPAEGTAAQ